MPDSPDDGGDFSFRVLLVGLRSRSRTAVLRTQGAVNSVGIARENTANFGNFQPLHAGHFWQNRWTEVPTGCADFGA